MPPEYFTPLAQFDGSVIAERTAGEVSARCHDEQANFLALNLMHNIVTGAKSVQEARDHYAKEFNGQGWAHPCRCFEPDSAAATATT